MIKLKSFNLGVEKSRTDCAYTPRAPLLEGCRNCASGFPVFCATGVRGCPMVCPTSFCKCCAQNSTSFVWAQDQLPWCTQGLSAACGWATQSRGYSTSIEVANACLPRRIPQKYELQVLFQFSPWYDIMPQFSTLDYFSFPKNVERPLHILPFYRFTVPPVSVSGWCAVMCQTPVHDFFSGTSMAFAG